MDNNYKILIIAPSWLGDLIMMQSLLKALHNQKKDLQIDVLAPSWCCSILNRMPEINNSIESPIVHGEMALLKRYIIGKKLRQKNYHEVIVLPNSFKSALIPFFAKIPKRTGWLGECRWGVLNDHRKLNKSELTSMVERFVRLAYPVNYRKEYTVEYPFMKGDTSNKSILESTYQLDLIKPVLSLCPGAAFGDAKCWPVEYYAKVAEHFLANDWQVWLHGAKNDLDKCNSINILTNNKCQNFAGKTSLLDAIDLLSYSSAVISNDSGLMHVSAALNIPLIAIYGPTDELFAPPLTSKAKSMYTNIECRPCKQRTCPLKHHKCMVDQEPAQIIKMIMELIDD